MGWELRCGTGSERVGVHYQILPNIEVPLGIIQIRIGVFDRHRVDITRINFFM
jgi:hypothetical protein